ncbi:unnamed protein product, partial [Prorocentrum cordatum]
GALPEGIVRIQVGDELYVIKLKRRAAEKISTIVYRNINVTNGWPQLVQCADKTWGHIVGDAAKELSETCMKNVMQKIIEEPTVTKADVSMYRNKVVNELRSGS